MYSSSGPEEVEAGAERLSGTHDRYEPTASKPVFTEVGGSYKMEPSGSIFTLGEHMDEVWTTIVAEALERGVRETKGPVPGAKLRQLIAHSAQQRGLEYPPPGFEGSNFGGFLKHFDSSIIVLRRRAQDILVAPVNRSELLMDVNSSTSQPQLREDVFAAFTHIPRDAGSKLPWYEPADDRIVWLEAAKADANETLIPIPHSTRNQEIADRRAFVASGAVGLDLRDGLVRTLDGGGSSVLWAFSQAIRFAGLSKKWHIYRFQLLTERIRRWSETQRIPWREEWLVAGGDSARSNAEVEIAGERASEKVNLKELLTALDETDLRRINVPLDIVLKFTRR